MIIIRRIRGRLNNHRMVNSSDESKNLVLVNELMNDGAIFKEDILYRNELSYYPIYEAKLIWLNDSKFASYENTDIKKIKASQPKHVEIQDKKNPIHYIQVRDYIKEEFADRKWLHRYNRQWFIIYRNVTGVANIRTTVAAIVPKRPVVLSAYLLYFTDDTPILDICLFYANILSFVFDYISRQKIGGSHLSVYIFDQLPVIDIIKYPEFLKTIIYKTVLELNYTNLLLREFANDCGYSGSPFKWDEERRFLLQCELDAAYFHLYFGTPEEWQETGSKELLEYFPTPRDSVDYIMETFPIVKRKDEQKHGEYRTKRVILEIYDEMAEAIHTGQPYQTRLDPPPADPRCAHPPRE